MRHAAVTFAEQVRNSQASGENWDVLFCTDMLNLAEFRGLCSTDISSLPAVIYFHENQLTYPTRTNEERDYHFAFTNFTSALAASEVWFNSEFHRREFFTAYEPFLKRLPDYQPLDALEQIRQKSHVHSPGIQTFPNREERKSGPVRILWSSRWEHDKNPEQFFDALEKLSAQGIDFRLSVLGESFKQVPACFEQARQKLAGNIDHWGYLPTRADYVTVLQTADIVVSTADHEFFGISILEAVSAGCFPLVPRRLAYPETLQENDDFFYDGSTENLVQRLTDLISGIETGEIATGTGVNLANRYSWEKVVNELDYAIENVEQP